MSTKREKTIIRQWLDDYRVAQMIALPIAIFLVGCLVAWELIHG